MFIAKVVGSMWATQKVPSLLGLKMLLVRQINPLEDNSYVGKIQMAVDNKIGAGVGDFVLVIDEGGSARQSIDVPKSPVRTAVIGIVDMVSVEGRNIRL